MDMKFDTSDFFKLLETEAKIELNEEANIGQSLTLDKIEQLSKKLHKYQIDCLTSYHLNDLHSLMRPYVNNNYPKMSHNPLYFDYMFSDCSLRTVKTRQKTEEQILKEAILEGIYQGLKFECDEYNKKIKFGEIKDFCVLLNSDFHNYIYRNHKEFFTLAVCKNASNKINDFEIVIIEDKII